ncbi:MAG: hypothetical protein GX575_00740 [Candidatus Anammoximicrobium sp.]|nr:hypothetical protein [Candidatus Anammoximicrobium sp.]
MDPIAMLSRHPVWGLLTLAALAWYSSVTVYVAIRGSMDIKHMLRSLSDQQRDG